MGFNVSSQGITYSNVVSSRPHLNIRRIYEELRSHMWGWGSEQKRMYKRINSAIHGGVGEYHFQVCDLFVLHCESFLFSQSSSQVYL